MAYLESKYIITKSDEQKTYALITTDLKLIVDQLTRDDIIKIMDDCSKWLDEDEQSKRGENG